MRLTGHTDDRWRELLAAQVRQHARLWFKLAYDILHDVHAAEDVCQQALLRGWAHREHLRDPGRLRAWIASTVVNESLQILRHRRVEQKAVGNIPRAADFDPPVDEAIGNRDAVVAAMASLPESVRTVVAMRVMQQMSGNEVKGILGCSAVQVSRMLHQGLEQLRKIMTEPGILSQENL